MANPRRARSRCASDMSTKRKPSDSKFEEFNKRFRRGINTPTSSSDPGVRHLRPSWSWLCSARPVQRSLDEGHRLCTLSWEDKELIQEALAEPCTKHLPSALWSRAATALCTLQLHKVESQRNVKPRPELFVRLRSGEFWGALSSSCSTNREK